MRHEQRADTRTCRKLSFTLGIPVWAVTCLSRAMRRRPCWCSPDSPDNGRHLTRSITHCLLSDDSRFCLTEGRRGGRLNLQLHQAWYIQDLRLFIKANADQKHKRFHISSFQSIFRGALFARPVGPLFTIPLVQWGWSSCWTAGRWQRFV